MNAGETTYLPPGSLLDNPPRLALANIRPYAVAILLHKGWLSRMELAATVIPHCNIDDLKVGSIDPFDGIEHDGTRLEKLIDQLLDEFSNEGFLQWSEATQNWIVATEKISKLVQHAITLNAMLPPQLLQYVQD
jgi:hypothetical protein